MRRRPFLCAAAFATFFPLLLAGCDEGPASNRLEIGVAESDQLQDVVARATGLTLTTLDAEGTVVGGLAQSWRLLDGGRTIVFRLRTAVAADGTPVTAADVVATLNAARRKGALLAPFLAGVVRVEAPVDSVIELELRTPEPELLELLANPALAIRIPGRAPFAAGPFVRKHQGAGKAGVELVRNARFFAADDVALAGVRLSTLSARDALQRFSERKLQVYLGRDLADYEAVRGDVPRLGRNGTLVIDPLQGLFLLLVNQRQPALADFRVRTALARGVDRVTIAAGLYQSSETTPVDGLVPAGIVGFEERPPDWANEPVVVRQAEARRLLVEAGYDGVGRKLALEMAIPARPVMQRLADMLRQSFAEIGVELQVRVLPPAAFREARGKGRFALALVEERSSFSSPLPFLLQFRCNANPFGACLPEADQLLKQAGAAQSFAERMETLSMAARLWAEDGTAIGLVEPLGWMLVAPRVRGLAANPVGVHVLRSMELESGKRILR